jgi:hypothetical protein
MESLDQIKTLVQAYLNNVWNKIREAALAGFALASAILFGVVLLKSKKIEDLEAKNQLGNTENQANQLQNQANTDLSNAASAGTQAAQLQNQANQLQNQQNAVQPTQEPDQDVENFYKNELGNGKGNSSH